MASLSRRLPHRRHATAAMSHTATPVAKRVCQRGKKRTHQWGKTASGDGVRDDDAYAKLLGTRPCAPLHLMSAVAFARAHPETIGASTKVGSEQSDSAVVYLKRFLDGHFPGDVVDTSAPSLLEWLVQHGEEYLVVDDRVCLTTHTNYHRLHRVVLQWEHAAQTKAHGYYAHAIRFGSRLAWWLLHEGRAGCDNWSRADHLAAPSPTAAVVAAVAGMWRPVAADSDCASSVDVAEADEDPELGDTTTRALVVAPPTETVEQWRGVDQVVQQAVYDAFERRGIVCVKQRLVHLSKNKLQMEACKAALRIAQSDMCNCCRAPILQITDELGVDGYQYEVDHRAPIALWRACCRFGFPKSYTGAREFAWLGAHIGPAERGANPPAYSTIHDAWNLQLLCTSCHGAKTRDDNALGHKVRADIKEYDRIAAAQGVDAADAWKRDRYTPPTVAQRQLSEWFATCCPEGR